MKPIYLLVRVKDGKYLTPTRKHSIYKASAIRLYYQEAVKFVKHMPDIYRLVDVAE